MKDPGRCCALILVIFVSLTGFGWAGSIAYTVNFSNRLPIPAIPQFDPALGQLLDVQATVTGNFSVEYESTPALTSATSVFSLLASLTREPSGFPFVVLGRSRSSTSYTGGLGNPFFVEGGFSVSKDLTTELDPFYGTGQIGLSLVENQALTDLIPVGAHASPITSSSSGTETITYTFAAPEPPGVIMAGTAALFGLACWLRHRMPRVSPST